MKINSYEQISCIKELWNSLFTSNKELTWFQSYEWNETLEKKFIARRRTRYCGCFLTYHVINDEIIAPLVVDRIHNRVEFLGERESSDYLSFIFADGIESKELKTCICALFLKYPKFSFLVDRLFDGTKLLSIMKELSICFIDTEHITKSCVWIDTRIKSETFYHSLSRNARQNYKTAVNRIIREGHSYEVFLENRKLSKDMRDKLLRIYEERRQSCDSPDSIIDKIVSCIRPMVKKCLGEYDLDVLSEYSASTPVFLAYILIDGEIAAFLEGNKNNNNRVLSIVRVALNQKYYKYSPGFVLMVEAIEKIKESLDYFDLTRGTEDYKFRLGGIVHNNHCFVVSPKSKLMHKDKNNKIESEGMF